MSNLWRAMALAWLGGLASPLLVDDAAIMDTLPVAAVAAPMSPASAALEPDDVGGDDGLSALGGLPGAEQSNH
ncbi:MAG TPA: hypothetical protein VMU87_06400 [Stellaceae bacterium]|nr:hypothetical protein [Stellaceae bacterium]